jgi:hypothetical protein
MIVTRKDNRRKSMAKKQEMVAKKSEGTVAAPSSQLFDQYAGSGLENVGTRDLLIPRLAILQDLSPQVKKQRTEYIKGAEAGLICDVGTGDLIGSKLHFLPVFYNKVWIEWAPRETKRGIVRVHDNDTILSECGINERNQPITEAGNLIAETAQFYGFNLDREMKASFLPMASSQLKVGRQWMTFAMQEKFTDSKGHLQRAPIFFRTYELETAHTNNGDNDWYLWKVTRGPSLEEMFPSETKLRDAIQACIDFKSQISTGAKKGDLSGYGESPEENASSGARRRGPVTDAEAM